MGVVWRPDSADTGVMVDDLERVEICARCGRPPVEGRVFCHVYHGPECLTFCSSQCALDFIEAPSAPGSAGSGHRTLEEIMEDLRWRNFGH